MNRYGKLLEIISQEKPGVILETGTWNGKNAIRMCEAALEHRPSVTYYGFDLWLSGNDATDAKELNVKARASHGFVRANMEGFADQQAGRGKLFSYRLFEGDTKESMPGFIDWFRRYSPPDDPFQPVDLAFIDGGHSLETIRADLSNVMQVMRPGGLIVCDDWYDGVPDNFIEKWGCNIPLRELGRTYVLVDGSDPLTNGTSNRLGTVHLALVRVPVED